MNTKMKLALALALSCFVVLQGMVIAQTQSIEPKAQSQLHDDSTLAKQLLEVQQRSLQSMSPERAAKYEESLRAIGETGVTHKALQVGSKAPMFELPNARGGKTALSEKLAKGPVVLTFYRGNWCPFCNLQLRALQQRLKDFDAMGASVIAISPQLPDSSLKAVDRNSLQFEVLSDVGSNVARKFNVLFTVPSQQKQYLERYNGSTGGSELPIAATYIIRQDSTITYSFLESDYRKRSEPEVLLRHLRELKNKR